MRIIKYILLYFIFAGFSYAQQLPVGHIDNFKKVDEKVYRGAQPDIKDFDGLKLLGINTVINLRDDPNPLEAEVVKALGMEYINIPMSGVMYPREADIQKILSLLSSPQTGKVFIHCKAGIHRTGVAIAVYRIHNYHWTYEQASKDAKLSLWYGFTSIFHARLWDYVRNYVKRTNGTHSQLRVALNTMI
jgi:protein tyrosine phosphatase (PTP) superfamily phosphohydrolase (DUF442 family)